MTPPATLDAGEPTLQIFLIADVRGYTSFTQERGDEAAAALATRFASIAHTTLEAGGGTGLELRGDEVLAVFHSARQAIRAATDLQSAFVRATISDPSLPLPVGIGLDAGEAVRVEDGYRGGALNLAARLCSLARPGEILASQEVVHLARRMEGVTQVDRGSFRLKGLADPVRVTRLTRDGWDPEHDVEFQRALGPRADPSAGAICPYRGLAAFQPEDADRFFGREGLVAELVARLDRERVLFVIGPSGSGKSSVVRAGLIPAVQAGSISGSDQLARCALLAASRSDGGARAPASSTRRRRLGAGRRTRPGVVARGARRSASARRPDLRRQRRAADGDRSVRGAVHAQPATRPGAVPGDPCCRRGPHRQPRARGDGDARRFLRDLCDIPLARQPDHGQPGAGRADEPGRPEARDRTARAPGGASPRGRAGRRGAPGCWERTGCTPARVARDGRNLAAPGR